MLFPHSQQVLFGPYICAKTSVLSSQGVGLELRMRFFISRGDRGNGAQLL